MRKEAVVAYSEISVRLPEGALYDEKSQSE
jgi:hypothetical protein